MDQDGDRLSYSLLRNLVYTNVLTMDRYLPSIIAVLEQGVSPEATICLVEQGEADSP